MTRLTLALFSATVLVIGLTPFRPALGDEGHAPPNGAETGEQTLDDHAPPSETEILEELIEEHKEHEHGHDFEVIESMSLEEIGRVMDVMRDVGLGIPPMDAHRGRQIFVDTGCVVCHQVNGVGGEVGPSLNAADLPSPMNAFEFAARMWRGAGPMIQMQEDLFGEQIDLTGQDLSDLVAFAHDEAEQKEFSADDIPQKFRDLIGE